MTQSRQLAAIMFTDIAGYTALMGEDEQLAFELLKKNRSIQRPIIEKFNGRWIKEIGDGVLASFSTVSDAVFCAKEIQEKCGNEPELKLRVGIHLGEVVFEGNDVFGDGVNIASRLEPLAPVGGILVSESIYKNVRNKKNIAFNYIGEELLRGVKDPVRVYQVEVPGSPAVDHKNQSKEHIRKIKWKFVWLVVATLLLGAFGYFMFNNNSELATTEDDVNHEKWIAVLPFVDMSAEQDQEYLGDGIAEELINTFAQAKDLKVIARTSSFQFKGENMDVRDVGSKLNAKYVVEGSVRKYEDQLRITVQLIDATDGSHIWSEDYDRPFDEIISIQSEIAKSVFDQLSSSLGLSNSKPGTNMEAYELYLKAMYLSRKTNREPNTIEDLKAAKEDFKAAERLFLQAIELDTNFVESYANLSNLYDSGIWMYPDDSAYKSKAKKYADIAFQKDPNSSDANTAKGLSLYRMDELEDAFYYDLRAVTINPMNPIALGELSVILHAFGLHQESFGVAKKLLEIDPLDYGIWRYYASLSGHIGQFREAKEAFEEEYLLRGSNPGNLFAFSCIMNDLENAKLYLADSAEMPGSHEEIESIWLAAHGDTAVFQIERHFLARLLLPHSKEDWSDYFDKLVSIQNTPLECCSLHPTFIMDPEIKVDEEFLNLMQPIISDPQYESSMRSFRECQENNRKRLKEELEQVRTFLGI